MRLPKLERFAFVPDFAELGLEVKSRWAAVYRFAPAAVGSAGAIPKVARMGQGIDLATRAKDVSDAAGYPADLVGFDEVVGKERVNGNTMHMVRQHRRLVASAVGMCFLRNGEQGSQDGPRDERAAPRDGQPNFFAAFWAALGAFDKVHAGHENPVEGLHWHHRLEEGEAPSTHWHNIRDLSSALADILELPEVRSRLQENGLVAADGKILPLGLQDASVREAWRDFLWEGLSGVFDPPDAQFAQSANSRLSSGKIWTSFLEVKQQRATRAKADLEAEVGGAVFGRVVVGGDSVGE